jgi:hypothetical protein
MNTRTSFSLSIFASLILGCTVYAEGDNLTTTYAGSGFEVSTIQGLRTSILPGPPRGKSSREFRLNPTNSLAMTGMNDEKNERWCDIAGNIYASPFIGKFSYESPATNPPIVRVSIDKKSPTFSGRLEAHGLKPNFAYQMKLRGIFSDRKSFEAIGYAGRWRLPGLMTNYRDEDYLAYEDKANAESYLFFDFFVTDANGNAVRDFALDACLHVLWSGTHQSFPDRPEDQLMAIVWVADPKVYARPKTRGSLERVWAEIESPRYKSVDQKRFLPAGDYNAEMVLTEESFHSWYRDGGYWATVSKVPVQFTVVAEDTAADAKKDK